MEKIINLYKRNRIKFLIFLSIFGPATITAMADNDASGVATYAIAGSKLGYPILFALFWITILLAIILASVVLPVPGGPQKIREGK